MLQGVLASYQRNFYSKSEKLSVFAGKIFPSYERNRRLLDAYRIFYIGIFKDKKGEGKGRYALNVCLPRSFIMNNGEIRGRCYLVCKNRAFCFSS